MDTYRVDIFNLLLILSIPIILLSANIEWLFPHGNPSDAWINSNYFFQTGNTYPPLYDLYKGTRLSWILKGYFAHKLFPPLTAYYILHLTMLVAILVTYYVLARSLFNERIATISAIAFGTYSQFHSVIYFEWDYEIHDGILNYLLTLLFLLWAAKGAKWKLWLVLAGAAFVGATQSTNVGTLVPAIFFWAIFLNYAYGKRPFLPSLLYILAGVLMANLFFCVVSYLLGGRFLYFMTLIKPILYFGFSGTFNFHPGYWFSLATILQGVKGFVLPLYATGLSAVALLVIMFKRDKGPLFRPILVTTISLLIVSLVSILLHLIGHGQITIENMLVFAAPNAFLGLTSVYACFRHSTLQHPSNWLETSALKIVVLLIFCGSLVFGVSVYNAIDPYTNAAEALWRVPEKFRGWRSIAMLQLLLSFSVIALVSCIPLARLRQTRTYIPVICLSGFLALLNVRNTSIPIQTYDIAYKCGYHENQYEAIIESFETLMRYDKDFNLRLWFKTNEFVTHPDKDCSPGNLINGWPGINLSDLYRGLHGMRYFTIITTPERGPHAGGASFDAFDSDGLLEEYQKTVSFADFSKLRITELEDSFRAAILSSTTDTEGHDTALNTLRAHGFKYNVLHQTVIHHGVVKFDMTILEVKKDARRMAESRL